MGALSDGHRCPALPTLATIMNRVPTLMLASTRPAWRVLQQPISGVENPATSLIDIHRRTVFSGVTKLSK